MKTTVCIPNLNQKKPKALEMIKSIFENYKHFYEIEQ